MQQQLYDNKLKTVLNWSSGKDAALSYLLLQQGGEYEVCSLLTTINAEQDRIVMHGVREQLLDMQAERMGVPLKKILLPPSPDNDTYNRVMADALEHFRAQGITTSAFGDIHLEDLKIYREQQLQQAGFKGLFPLWGRDTRELVQVVEQAGIEAMIVCVNEEFLGEEFLGRRVDSSLLADLPANVDPCGEYGEFHTFVYNAPYFSSPIAVNKGEIVRRLYTPGADKGFLFMDIYP